MRTGDGKFRPLAPEASTSTRRRPCLLDIHRADPPVDEVDGPDPAVVVGNPSDIRDLHPLLLRHRHRLLQ